jgi:hypothetical protein
LAGRPRPGGLLFPRNGARCDVSYIAITGEILKITWFFAALHQRPRTHAGIFQRLSVASSGASSFSTSSASSSPACSSRTTIQTCSAVAIPPLSHPTSSRSIAQASTRYPPSSTQLFSPARSPLATRTCSARPVSYMAWPSAGKHFASSRIARRTVSRLFPYRSPCVFLLSQS